jgi:CRP-like cAMP-binding protein
MGIEEDIAVLERVPSFAVLGREALRILAIGAESRYVRSGEVLFRAGEPADAGFLVQDGSFTLKESAASSESQAVVARRGALLGEFALLKETTRPMTATAAEPSNVLRITRALFLKMLEGYPDAAQRLRDHIAGRSIRTAEEIRRLGATLVSDAPARVR